MKATSSTSVTVRRMRARDKLWLPKPQGHVLVAEQGGRIVGVTAYAMTPQGYAYGTQHEIHPDFRGQGLGDLLHGERLVDAKKRGATHFVGATLNPAMAKILEEWGGLKVPVKDPEGKDVYVNGLGC
jgi:GNAT superfamily N-acetyltransferase